MCLECTQKLPCALGSLSTVPHNGDQGGFYSQFSIDCKILSPDSHLIPQEGGILRARINNGFPKPQKAVHGEAG